MMRAHASHRLRQAAWLILVLFLSAGAVLFGLAHQHFLPWAAIPLSVAATAPLLVLRRWPALALGLVAGSNAVFVVAARLAWPPTAGVAWLLALGVSPLLLSRGRAVVLLAGTEAAILAAVVVPASVNPRPWDAPITEALAILLVWGAGERLRARVESRAHRAEAAEQVRVLQKSEAIARGRAEVARELHDVVAHHVSLIAVRAATAPYQIKDLSPEAGETLFEIAAEARTALEELRSVLGILRAPDGQVLQAPQPRLAQLPDLLERMRATGMVICATTEGAARELPETIELCCYRIAQEALTNAARHAPGVEVKLTLSYLDQAVAIGVSNPVAAVAQPTGQAGSGYGLTGMRERVAALGGTFHAAPCETSFRVEARIPLTAASDER
jgi:signal transduction histidine kinase